MNIVVKSVLIVAFASPLASGAQSRTALAIAAGPSIPVGTFRDTQNQGLDLNVGLIRGSDDSPLGFRLDFGYDRFPGKTVNGVKNSDRRIVAGTADLVLSASGYTFKPYAIAGAGAFKMTSKPAVPDAKTRFGFDFGIGFTLPLASRAVFIESRLNNISQHNAKPLRYMPIVLGLLF
jgi:hypothetical protein